jgi:MFS family permease
VIGHGFLGGYGIGFIIALLVAVWVATDANKRGMNGILWGIGVFLVCIVFLPIYLIVRKPLLAQQQPYSYPPPGSHPPQPYGYNPPAQPSQPSYTPPPPAAQPSVTPSHHFCSNCGSPLDVGAKFCPNCGKPA